MRWIFIIVAIWLLAGCSGFNLRDNLSDVSASTVGAAVATINPAAGVVAGIATGVAVNAVTQPEELDVTQVENEYQAEVAESKIFWDFVTSFVEWIVGGVVLLIIAAWLIPGPQSLFRRSNVNTEKPS